MSSSQEEENATTVWNDQMTIYIRVWYHQVILYECFATLEKAQKSLRNAIFHKTTTRAKSTNSEGHSLFILIDKHTSAT